MFLLKTKFLLIKTSFKKCHPVLRLLLLAVFIHLPWMLGIFEINQYFFPEMDIRRLRIVIVGNAGFVAVAL